MAFLTDRYTQQRFGQMGWGLSGVRFLKQPVGLRLWLLHVLQPVSSSVQVEPHHHKTRQHLQRHMTPVTLWWLASQQGVQRFMTKKQMLHLCTDLCWMQQALHHLHKWKSMLGINGRHQRNLRFCCHTDLYEWNWKIWILKKKEPWRKFF